MSSSGMAQAKGLPMGRRKGQQLKWSTAKRKVDPEPAQSLRSQGVKVTDIAERFGCSKQGIYDALKY